MKIDLSIIIVNYKTPYLTIECIESILQNQNEITLEIIVVDNSSKDNSAALIRSKFDTVRIIENTINEGFGRANNIGVKEANGEYLLFLNSDAILSKYTLTKALENVRKMPRIGVYSVTILNEDGSEQQFTKSVASFRKVIEKNLIFNYCFGEKELPIESVMGSFMIISRSTFVEAGMFDPDFFMYCEENELCHRIVNKYNLELYIDKKITVTHKNGGSTPDRSWANRQAYLSSALMFYKIKGHSGYLLYHFLNLTNIITNFFAMWFIDKNYRKGYYKDVSYYLANAKTYLTLPVNYNRKIGNGKRLLKSL